MAVVNCGHQLVEYSVHLFAKKKGEKGVSRNNRSNIERNDTNLVNMQGPKRFQVIK
jgi:hypothetical protein